MSLYHDLKVPEFSIFLTLQYETSASTITGGLEGFSQGQRTNHVPIQPGVTPHCFRSTVTFFSPSLCNISPERYVSNLLDVRIRGSWGTVGEFIGPCALPWCLCVGARTLAPCLFGVMAGGYPGT